MVFHERVANLQIVATHDLGRKWRLKCAIAELRIVTLKVVAVRATIIPPCGLSQRRILALL